MTLSRGVIALRDADPGFVSRLTRAFVAPAETERGRDTAEAAVAAAVAVLCPPEHAWAVGGAVALTRGRTAIVAVCGPDLALPTPRAPGTPAARKLAARLRARGHDAAASGRVVHLLLGAYPGAEAARVVAAPTPPCVTVIAGPRDERIDALLRTQDHVLVDAEEAIADLALTSLAAADVPARRVEISTAPAAARALAAAGVALVPPLRATVEKGLR